MEIAEQFRGWEYKEKRHSTGKPRISVEDADRDVKGFEEAAVPSKCRPTHAENDSLQNSSEEPTSKTKQNYRQPKNLEHVMNSSYRSLWHTFYNRVISQVVLPFLSRDNFTSPVASIGTTMSFGTVNLPPNIFRT
jgi:hypothetical protein